MGTAIEFVADVGIPEDEGDGVLDVGEEVIPEILAVEDMNLVGTLVESTGEVPVGPGEFGKLRKKRNPAWVRRSVPLSSMMMPRLARISRSGKEVDIPDFFR